MKKMLALVTMFVAAFGMLGFSMPTYAADTTTPQSTTNADKKDTSTTKKHTKKKTKKHTKKHTKKSLSNSTGTTTPTTTQTPTTK
jgi:cytoskeletal protein RodZ